MTRDADVDLVLDYLHGQLSDDAVQSLCTRLREDRALGQLLQRLAQEEGLIGEWAQAKASPGDLSPESLAPIAERPQARVRPLLGDWRWYGVGVAVAAAIAGLVLFAWPAAGPQHLATIQHAVDARFEDDADGQLGRRLFASDWVRLEAGFVEIAFRAGPRVVLEGPADFQIAGERAAILERGTLSAEAHDGEFEITTPAGVVTDVGTRFAVAVADADQTSVEVFEGEVRARSAAVDAAVTTLATGKAALVDRARPQLQPLAAGQAAFKHVRARLQQVTVEATADHFARGGSGNREVQREQQNEWMLLKRDPWKRLDVCRKAWIRFALAGMSIDPAAPATFTFRHANSNRPGSKASHFVGKVQLYALRAGFVPQGQTLGIDWSERHLTWQNAPGNNAQDASAVSPAADLLGSVDVNAGPGGTAAGTSFAIEFSNLARYLQKDGTATFILTVAKQSSFDPNLYVVAHESPEFAGPLLTFATKSITD